MRRKLKPRNNIVSSKEGFTLVEVMVAMVCSMVALLALSSLSSGTWHGVTVSKTTTESSVLGSGFMESLISRSYQDAEIQNGVHSFEEDDYTVSYLIGDNAILPSTKYVQMDVSYNLKGSPKSVRMYYLLPRVIR